MTTWAYFWVVVIEACPSRRWTCSRGTPSRSHWVAASFFEALTRRRRDREMQEAGWKDHQREAALGEPEPCEPTADRSKIVCAALIALSVTACAQGGPADPIGDGCQTFRPIFLADYEWALLSDETALAIEGPQRDRCRGVRLGGGMIAVAWTVLMVAGTALGVAPPRPSPGRRVDRVERRQPRNLGYLGGFRDGRRYWRTVVGRRAGLDRRLYRGNHGAPLVHARRRRPAPGRSTGTAMRGMP